MIGAFAGVTFWRNLAFAFFGAMSGDTIGDTITLVSFSLFSIFDFPLKLSFSDTNVWLKY